MFISIWTKLENTYLREEEIKWCQWAKVKTLLEDDTNTKHFQLVVDGKKRKIGIFQLE